MSIRSTAAALGALGLVLAATSSSALADPRIAGALATSTTPQALLQTVQYKKSKGSVRKTIRSKPAVRGYRYSPYRSTGSRGYRSTNKSTYHDKPAIWQFRTNSP